MTSYATVSDLAEYMPSGSLAMVTTAQQTRALADASSEADGALGNHFTLPLLAPYPPDVTKNVCKRAAAELMALAGYSVEGGANQWVRDYRADAAAYFAAVSTGKITPPGILDSSPNVSTGGALCTSYPQRGWTNYGGRGGGPGFWGPG